MAEARRPNYYDDVGRRLRNDSRAIYRDIVNPILTVPPEAILHLTFVISHKFTSPGVNVGETHRITKVSRIVKDVCVYIPGLRVPSVLTGEWPIRRTESPLGA